MVKNYHRWFAVCSVLLFVIVGLQSVDIYCRMDEQRIRQKVTDDAKKKNLQEVLQLKDEQRIRQKITDDVLKSILEVETDRLNIIKDLNRSLKSYSTKSVYHQIYLMNNAQMKMMNLIVQENLLLLKLIAGKN